MNTFFKNKITELENRLNSLVIPKTNNNDDEFKKEVVELKILLKTNQEKIESLEKDFLGFKNLTNDNTKNTSTNLQTLSNNLNIVNKNIEDMSYKKTIDTVTKMLNDVKTSSENSTKKIETFEKNIKTLTDGNSSLNKKVQSLEQKLSTSKQV